MLRRTYVYNSHLSEIKVEILDETLVQTGLGGRNMRRVDTVLLVHIVPSRLTTPSQTTVSDGGSPQALDYVYMRKSVWR